MNFVRLLTALLLAVPILVWAQTSPNQTWDNVISADGSSATARHESGVASVNGKLYLFGGRGTRPVEVFDVAQKTWREIGPMPLELHHFQPVVVGTRIYFVGAFTCCYPNEPAVADVHVFDTQTEQWSTAGTLPVDRQRGSAGAAVRFGKIYLLGGNTDGHSGGAVPWFDEFDPASGEWKKLADAPNARDHFGAVIVANKLVAASGRQTAQPNPFTNVVSVTDIYDFSSNTWTTSTAIPTPRAGAVSVPSGSEVIVVGGEINTSSFAYDVVEAFDVNSGNWRSLHAMNLGRHSGGGVRVGNQLHMLVGSLKTGGGPETATHETLALDTGSNSDFDADGLSNDLETGVYGTNPNDPDSDDDGLEDGAEINSGTDPLNSDSDGDGLGDGDEVNVHATNPLAVDTDGDELDDGAEINSANTNPLVRDSDGDGLDDGQEVQLQTDPLAVDSDTDGLQDGDEVQQYLTDPLLADSDSDGLTDGDEISLYNSNPTLADSDGDTLLDGEEAVQYHTHPGRADTDFDGLNDAVELQQYFTDPLLPDTDNDGLSDSIEVAREDTDPRKADSDDDGLNDGDELSAGTDPADPDSDGDGLLDGEDADPLVAQDSGGGAIGWLLAMFCALVVGRLSQPNLFGVKFSTK